MNCPTPYKDCYANKGHAKAVIKEMRVRVKKGKTRYNPIEAYDCPCGGVHLATPKRIAAHGKWTK